MSFTDVMYGPLGQVNNQFQNNLGQNAAMNQNQQAAMAQQQQAMAAQQAQLAALYGSQGFGGQTAQYAAAGAAAGRNTGGFGGYGGMNDPFSPAGGYGYNPLDAGAGYGFDNSSYLSGLGQYGQPGGGLSSWPTYPGGGGGDFSFPAQPQPQVDWSSYFNQLTAPQSPYAGNSGGLATLPGGGINPNDPGNIALYYQIMQGGGGGIPAAAPSPQATLGYDPSTLYQNAMGYPGGGASSYFNPASYGSLGMGIPAQTQQNADLYYQILAQGGNTSWLGAGGANNSYNPFGQINSGQVGGADAFYGYPAGQPSGMGGIGSDTSRDPYAWLYAQSSPYASSLGVPSSPTANLGYNPGMSNYFANPSMRQGGAAPGDVNAATQQMQGLLDWYNQLMFDPNSRQVGSDVPPLPENRGINWSASGNAGG